MDQRFCDESNDFNEPNTKRRKSNNATEQNLSEFPNRKQPPDIFKMDIDCFEETFDYLPLKDLISVGKTCKRLQQVIGYCLQEYYSAAVVECREQAICINYDLKADYFAQFIRKLRIDSFRDFIFFLNIQTIFHRLRQIKVGNFEIAKAKTQRMATVLSKIEYLRFNCCKINGEFYETVLAFCPNLKRLSVEATRTGCDWFGRKYPAMERVELISNNIDGITAFLELNPNIRQFATNAVCLWQNRQSLLSANIALDNLAVRIIDGNEVDLNAFCELLQQLHARGVYRRLHLYSLYGLNQQTVNRFAALSGLVKMYISHVGRCVALSNLTNLQELCIFINDQIIDLDAVIRKITNLKRIQFRFASIQGILPLICRATELRKIKVDWLEDGEHFCKQTNIIDLIALNNKRQKLPGAQKITFYVREDIYLATKWALKQTDFSLIRLKRTDAFEWDHEFDLD